MIGNEVITIDGLVGSGKSTTARLLAQRLRFRHLDTGAMYRVVALAASKVHILPNHEGKLKKLLEDLDIELLSCSESGVIFLNGEDVSEAIRRPDITRIVGSYADQLVVRNFLVERQRGMGKFGGTVADGRDMASVVFPDADFKFRMVADIDERSRRRHTELLAKGIECKYLQVREDIQRRDIEDASRDYGKTSSIDDVVEIDTSNWTIEEQVQKIYSLILIDREKIKS
tara:strand:+ start:7717 stop:8403 length:687 start_codon:yes stop_codon:yes gene_type:complete